MFIWFDEHMWPMCKDPTPAINYASHATTSCKQIHCCLYILKIDLQKNEQNKNRSFFLFSYYSLIWHFIDVSLFRMKIEIIFFSNFEEQIKLNRFLRWNQLNIRRHFVGKQITFNSLPLSLKKNKIKISIIFYTKW